MSQDQTIGPGETPIAMRVRIDYTNYRGERSIRTIAPETLFFGTTEFHPELQWLLVAIDLEKSAQRTFAMKDIHSWMPV